ncbi:MAG: STAS domain-containing protein [Ferruginibacter sp.]|nr:STAS domain-containing protein [Cytophagales bacterium]
MDIKVSNEDTFHVIAVNGDLDASSSIGLDNALKHAFVNNEKRILVDCSQLNYISSAGLGVFMSYLQEFEDHHVSIALFGVSSKILDVFQILGLDQLLTIAFSKEAAKLSIVNEL